MIQATFGNLTVINRTVGRTRVWDCLCHCGKIISVNEYQLTSGRRISCGCGKNTIQHIVRDTSPQKTKGRRRKDLTGKKFNWLTGIRFEGTHAITGNSFWSFKCDCGNEITRIQRQVVRGDITSCGCKKSERAKQKQTLPNNQAIKNCAYKIHKKAARFGKRNIDSRLTQSEYESVAQHPCAYCGETSIRKGFGKERVEIPFNSVDRLNNESFYDLTNSVPACFECQKAKGKMPYKKFLEMCARVTSFQTQIAKECKIDDAFSNLSQLPRSDLTSAP